MANIIVTASIVIPSGPQLAIAQTLEVDAYDKIDITIPKPPASKAQDMEVQLQPGGLGQVQFISIISDWYGPSLTYKVNNDKASAILLDQPHLLAGAGAVSLYGQTEAPTRLYFTNASTGDNSKPAKVQILIGRRATPTA